MSLQLKPKTFIFMDCIAYWWGQYGCSSPSTRGLQAQWICLPSCRPRFESEDHYLCFHQFMELWDVEKTKINKKKAEIGQKRFWALIIRYLQDYYFTDYPIQPKLNRRQKCLNPISKWFGVNLRYTHFKHSYFLYRMLLPLLVITVWNTRSHDLTMYSKTCQRLKL